MSKADNMLSILWLLKKGKRLTAQQLADELEIHVRTVYRCIDALCASGVPIVADAGHHGGYSLLESFNEAPLFFDLEEQTALVHSAAFAQQAGYPYGEALERAVAKLKRYTNEEQLHALERRESGLRHRRAEAVPDQPDLLCGLFRGPLRQRLRNRLPLELEKRGLRPSSIQNDRFIRIAQKLEHRPQLRLGVALYR